MDSVDYRPKFLNYGFQIFNFAIIVRLIKNDVMNCFDKLLFNYRVKP